MATPDRGDCCIQRPTMRWHQPGQDPERDWWMCDHHSHVHGPRLTADGYQARPPAAQLPPVTADPATH